MHFNIILECVWNSKFSQKRIKIFFLFKIGLFENDFSTLIVIFLIFESENFQIWLN